MSGLIFPPEQCPGWPLILGLVQISKPPGLWIPTKSTPRPLYWSLKKISPPPRSFVLEKTWQWELPLWRCPEPDPVPQWAQETTPGFACFSLGRDHFGLVLCHVTQGRHSKWLCEWVMVIGWGPCRHRVDVKKGLIWSAQWIKDQGHLRREGRALLLCLGFGCGSLATAFS